MLEIIGQIIGDIISIFGQIVDGLRRAIPGIDGWFWLALFIGSMGLGIRHVIHHMRHGRVSIGGAVVGTKGRTDESGASLFRSAHSNARRPSLSPLYGKPAWYRAVPYPVLVILAWGWVYYRIVTVLILAAFGAWIVQKALSRVAARRHRNAIVKPLAAVLAPALEVRPDFVLEGLVIPPNWQDDRAQVVVPLPDAWRPDQISNAAKLVAVRLGGEWNHRRSDMAPYNLTFSHKPSPPSSVATADVAHLLIQGDVWHPFLGLGTERNDVRLDFSGAVVHLGMSAGTGAGKSVLNLLLGGQFLFHGGEVIGIDVAGNSFDAMEGFPGFTVYNDVDDLPAMWDAIHAVRLEMDARRRGKRGNSEKAYDPLILFLEEQNMFATFTKSLWKQIKDKSDPEVCPVFDDIKMLYYMARQFQIRVVGTYQRMTADAVGGGNAAEGGAMRDQFGNKLLSRFSPSAWDSLVGTRPRGVCPDIPGRWLLVKNSGMHHQVQVPFFQKADAVELLRASRYGLSPQPSPKPIGRHPYEIAAPSEGLRDRDTAGGVLLPFQRRAEGSPAILRPSETVTEKRYTLEEACEAGIIPLGYEAAKRRRTRAREAGREFPAGVKDGRATIYTAEELREWWESESESEKRSS